jgi:hypothetical protein
MKALFTIFFGFVTFTIFAQPVINYSTHAPSAGDFNSYSGVEFINPGSDGKNIVWDFSDAIANGKITISEQTNADVQNAAKFEFEHQIVLEENGNNFFHSLNSDSYAMTGVTNKDFEIYYHKPLTRMIYPFAYSNHFEGELKATSVSTADRERKTEISGNYIFNADAYGEIILPGGIHKKVLRVYQYSTSVQVTACTEINIESHKYMWFSAEDRYPIATTIIQDKRYCNGKTESSSETWINNKYMSFENVKPEAENDNLSSVAELNVFPNPFKENAEISVLLTQDADLSISIYNAAGIKIKDVCSKSFYKKGIHIFELNEDEISLKPGLYFVRLEANGKTVIKKLIRNQ